MKKKLISIALCLSLLLGLTGCGNNNTTTLIMADCQEDGHPTAKASDRFAELVNKRTNGRIKIEVYHGTTLGSEAEQCAQVSVGGIDFVRASTSVISNYDDNLKAFQALYLYPNDEAMWKVLDGKIGDEFLHTTNLAANGIQGLCWFSGGSRNFYNNQREVKSPEDLKGLKIRVNTDSMFAFLSKCGAKGENVAYGDIHDSIVAGIIDGAENNWPSYISTEHYKVAKYITIDEHTRVPEMIIASIDTMNTLSPEDQQIIRECALEASQLQRKWLSEYDAEAIETAEKEGCTITYLTEEEVEAFQTAAESVNADVSAPYIPFINKIQKAQEE